MKLLKSLGAPIIQVVGLNLFTLLVFVTAPVQWDTDNVTALCWFVLLCQLLILIGFELGRGRGAKVHPERRSPLFSGDRATKYLFAFYGVTFLIGYAYRMGLAPSDVAGMASLLLDGLDDRHFGYQMALRGTGLGPVPWTVFFLVSIPNQIFFIVGFVQWKRLRTLGKLFFIFCVCIELFFTTGRGVAFGVVSMATTFYLSTMLSSSSTSGRNRLRVVRPLGYAALILFLFAGSIAFFSFNLYRRSGNVERGIQIDEFGKSTTNLDHLSFALVPEPLHPTYLNVVAYLCGGYYRAALALDLPFESTWLLGNNPALIDLASLSGLDVWDRTYMHRLEVDTGMDAFAYWHSAYTWFASDVSFFGVPLLLCIIAYFFGFSWSRSLQGDFVSKIVFVILGNILLFLFANNTYLSTVFYSVMFLFPFFLFTRFRKVAVLNHTAFRRTGYAENDKTGSDSGLDTRATGRSPQRVPTATRF